MFLMPGIYAAICLTPSSTFCLSAFEASAHHLISKTWMQRFSLFCPSCANLASAGRSAARRARPSQVPVAQMPRFRRGAVPVDSLGAVAYDGRAKEDGGNATMRILITGGAGFLGHHFVEHVLKNTGWHIVVLDRLTYASHGLERLRDISAFDNRRVLTLTADLASPLGAGLEQEVGEPDYIVHLAAETHVDNSIADPWPFVRTNVLGTFHMLELARRLPNLQRFVYFSTDEVFGPAPKGVAYKEWDRYNSTNPYSATKAAAEELCLAWANTYKLPVMITHTMNAFGERQHPEKFIPKTIRKVLAGETVTIHADPTRTISGSRFWIHCRNVASAVLLLLEHGQVREKYNIVGEREASNLELAQRIADTLGKPLKYEMVDFHSSRPGHDLRYALDGQRMAKLGWKLPVDFEHSLAKTVRWMVHPDHARWLDFDDAAKPVRRSGAR